MLNLSNNPIRQATPQSSPGGSNGGSRVSIFAIIVVGLIFGLIVGSITSPNYTLQGFFLGFAGGSLITMAAYLLSYNRNVPAR